MDAVAWSQYSQWCSSSVKANSLKTQRGDGEQSLEAIPRRNHSCLGRLVFFFIFIFFNSGLQLIG